MTTKLNANDIALALGNSGDHIRRYEIMLPNVYYQYDSEADLFCIRKSGFCDEFEIKISRSDFLAEKNKYVRYRDMTREEYGSTTTDSRGSHYPNEKQKMKVLELGKMCINYFWYVLAEGIAQESEVPAFAGLITVNPDCRLKIVRNPRRLHSNKLSIERRYMIARKSTYRFWNLKNQLKSMENGSKL